MPKRVWTPERVTSEILEMQQQGVDLRHGSVQEKYKRLVSAAIRYFGSWRAAVEAAGVDYEELRRYSEEIRLQKIGKWSQERILEEIRALCDRDEDLRAVIVKNKFPSLFSAAVSPRYFSNWRKALEAAGVDYDKVLQKSPRGRPRRTDVWHTGLILDMIRSMSERGESLEADRVSVEHPRLMRLATNRLGSWHAALELALDQSPRKSG